MDVLPWPEVARGPQAPASGRHYGPRNLHSLAGDADQFGQRELWRRHRPVIPDSYAPRAAIKIPNEGDEMAALLSVARDVGYGRRKRTTTGALRRWRRGGGPLMRGWQWRWLKSPSSYEAAPAWSARAARDDT
jgi:hypothetical protein